MNKEGTIFFFRDQSIHVVPFVQLTESLKLTVLEYVRAAYLLEDEYVRAAYLLEDKQVQCTCNCTTVLKGLFGVQIFIFK